MFRSLHEAPFALFALTALLLAACSSPSEPAPANTGAANPDTGNSDTASSRAAKPDAAKVAAAQAAYERARAAFHASDFVAAFEALDQGLEATPNDPAGWELLGRVSMAAAPSDARPNLVYRDALSAFARAIELGGGPELAFLASRAARFCPDPDEALRWAAIGLEKQAEPTAEDRRIAIEAYLDAYLAKKQANEDTRALADVVRVQAEKLIASSPEGVERGARYWLATLYEWEEQLEQARALRVADVEANPGDEAAHLRLITLLRKIGGYETAAAYYEQFRTTHPDHALATWFEASERFERGCELFAAGQDGAPSFRRAEELYRQARALAPDWQDRCLGFEVICRAGVGYSLMSTAADGDDARLAEAEEAFFSMEELMAGGLDWSYEGKLRSGVVGLQFLAERGNRVEGNNLVGEKLDRAARIYWRLHQARPEDPNLANTCGYLHREVGVEQAQRARAGGEGAAEIAAQARSTLTKCRDAYLAAARYAPDDVRIVNDAGLILLYHFPSRLEEAERLFLHAVEKGTEQLASPDLDPEARDLLTEAYGDAHQNLGLLNLGYRHDPDKAEPYYRRAVEIGPARARRPPEVARALDACARLRAGETTPLEVIDPRIWHAE